jgi:ABC-2 type transport system permease protein
MTLHTFVRMMIAQATILRRNVTFWLVSIFIAVLSMLVFGTLFNPGAEKFSLTFVDEDGTAQSGELAATFDGLPNAEFDTGDRAEALSKLQEGDRDAVVVAGAGFADALAAGQASVDAYYDDSQPIRIGYVTATVESVVEAYSEQVSGGQDAVVVVEQLFDTESTSYLEFLTPGMIGMTIMFTNLAVGFMIVNWRELGILRRLGVTPLRPGVFIASQGASFGLVSLAQVTALILIAAFVFDVPMRGSFVWLAVTGVLGVLCMLSIGYLIASFAHTVTSYSVFQQLVTFPMLFLGGSYFPLDAPPMLAPVVQMLPLTHLNNALREIVNHGGLPGELWVDWLAMAAWAVVGFALSIRLFRWQ